MKQVDIDTAVCRSRRRCAIAQTIYRQLDEDFGRVRVTAAGITIAKSDQRYYYKAPECAVRLVRDFDDGKRVKPINFTIHLAHTKPITATPDEEKKRRNRIKRELREIGLQKEYPKGRYAV